MYKAAKAVLNARRISDYVTCGAPCGACRELMVQLMAGKYHEIEIMLDYAAGRTITLGEITPEWWIQ